MNDQISVIMYSQERGNYIDRSVKSYIICSKRGFSLLHRYYTLYLANKRYFKSL